jgi:hypothetical protein
MNNLMIVLRFIAYIFCYSIPHVSDNCFRWIMTKLTYNCCCPVHLCLLALSQCRDMNEKVFNQNQFSEKWYEGLTEWEIARNICPVKYVSQFVSSEMRNLEIKGTQFSIQQRYDSQKIFFLIHSSITFHITHIHMRHDECF